MDEPRTSHLPPGLAWLRSAALALGCACVVLFAIDWLVMPLWGERSGGPGSPVPRARELLDVLRPVAAALLLACLLVFWALLFRFAARAGGATYATGHLVLSVLLTPVAFTGVAVLPLIVAREVADGTAAHRRRTMRFGWLDLFVLVAGAALVWFAF